MPGRAKIGIPRWIQLAGFPVLLLFLWVVAGAVRHVVFLFLVALLIALLLSPVVRLVHRVRLPRGFAVALVYLVFAVALIAAIGALGTVLVNETKTAAKRVDSYFTDVNGQTGQVDAGRDVDRLQQWLNAHSLGSIHVRKPGQKYALVFGAWVAITELIPYLGPWLGSIPPFIYAFVVHPLSAVWVALLFLAIHQVEGHVVVPNVMGSALRLHPLLVIFGLLAGGELYGLPGLLVALPFLAVMRALWEFFGERVQF